MARSTRKILVVGKLRFRLPRFAKEKSSELKEKIAPLVRRKVRIGIFNIPIVFFLVALLAVLPIGMAFGEEHSEPVGRNLLDSENPLVRITNVEFYTGTPADEEKIPIQNLTYPDGTKIQNGNFWVSFGWQLIDPLGEVAFGDYFDVVLDLGLATIPAEVSQQVGTFAPIIVMSNGQTAGSIKWINQKEYQTQQRIVIRIELNQPDFKGLIGGGEEGGPVNGTGVWGFQYKAGESADGDGTVVWEIQYSGDFPAGTVRVDPDPPEVGKPVGGGNDKYNPYDEFQKGYNKIGTRLTADNVSIADSIFYWNVVINGHKHSTIEEWQKCPYDDPPLPVDENGQFKETFTIVDEGKYIAPTWLRNVTDASGKPKINTDDALLIDRGNGLYGPTAGETVGPAYIKLYYVNSEYIWNDRINHPNSNYQTPANDGNTIHRPSEGNPVGSYDPYFNTWYLREGEASSVLYAPNYSGPGGKYSGYLTPVPPSDIRSITLKQNGYEIEMVSNAVLGKTLAIAYMSKPATDANGVFHKDVGNSVYIKDANGGKPVSGSSGAVLVGGTIAGSSLESPNKGSFVIEKYDLNDATPMSGVGFNVVASSNDKTLEAAANALISEQKQNSVPPGSLMTDAGGKLSVTLPPLPWAGGSPLTLTVTESKPEGYIGLQPFTVVLEPENGTVISYDANQGDKKLIQITADQYGVYAWNRSAVKDMSFYDAALRKWIKKVDRVIDGETYNVFYSEELNSDTVSVKNGDKILFRVDVYNQCFNKIGITGITDWLPPGLKFDKGATIAHNDPGQPYYNNNLWELVQGTGGAPDILNYVGPEIWLEPMAGVGGTYPEYRIPLVLTVDVPEDLEETTVLSNVARIDGLKDANLKDVEDSDSFMEKDRDSAGPVPGIEYTDMPTGTIIDNEIEGHRKNVDGDADLTEDEDSHDYASVIIYPSLVIACDVDKDTIRRTSAAFEGLPGQQGFANVGSEEYRYDIDFRSTSSLPADEFVVDDPLENVANDQVRITGVWLPAVWGDEDGKMNVWYKSNNVKVNNDPIPASAREVTSVPLDKQLYPTKPEDGWRLWVTVDKSLSDKYKNEGVIERVALGLPSDLAKEDYITAIRFEYGAVKVGFTSKNYLDYSMNGEHKNQNGELMLAASDIEKINSIPQKSTVQSQSTAAPASTDVIKENFFTKLFSSSSNKKKEASQTKTDTNAETEQIAQTTGVVGLGGSSQEITALDNGNVVDWTPNPMYPDYSSGAKNATGLMPASYLVVAIKPMENESIVSSAISRIARQSLRDEAVDAVVTYQLTTFSLQDVTSQGYTLEESVEENIPKVIPQTETGALGRTTRTYDDMNLVFWIGMALMALTGAFLVFVIWNRRKRLLTVFNTSVKKRRRGR